LVSRSGFKTPSNLTGQNFPSKSDQAGMLPEVVSKLQVNMRIGLPANQL
jgi:hypothetical protein